MDIALIRLPRYILEDRNGVDTTIRTVEFFTPPIDLSDV